MSRNLHITTLAALAAGVFLSQPALAGKSAAAKEAEGYVSAICPDRSPEDCERIGEDFIKEYERAMRGEYQAQRNVAFALGGRETGSAVVPNFVQGCAWRLVIMMLGDPRVGPGDASNMKLECGRLDEAGRMLAATRSVAIRDQIARGRPEAKR